MSDLPRIVPIEGGLNFRDLGGYQTASGETVRFGRLFRSGTLTNLTDDGVSQLAELGVATIFDLRSDDEIAKAPDRIPDGVSYQHRPVRDPSRVSRLKAIWTVLTKRDRLEEALLEVYTRVMIDANAHVIGEIMRHVATSDQPTVIHCTAGKDRTGITSALLLLTLGVPRETVLADYAVSSRYAEQIGSQIKSDIEQLRRFGLKDAHIQPLLYANPDMLEKALKHIEVNYDSVMAYVNNVAGCDADSVASLKQKLLTTDDL